MSHETPLPPPGIVFAGHFEQDASYHAHRTYGARDWLLVYTNSGVGRYVLHGKTVVCGAGDVMLLMPGMPHDYATASGATPWNFYWVHFTPRVAWLGWLGWSNAGDDVPHLSISDPIVRQRLSRTFERLVTDSRGTSVWHDELTHNALAEILILLAQHHAHIGERRVDPRIDVVVHQLATRLAQPLTLDMLAQEIALSPSRLAHLFKAHMGEPIMVYRMKLRLRHAARLLEFTTRQVSEIARDVGFESLFHFSRQFKVYYGVSPNAYRRQRMVAAHQDDEE